MIIPFHPVMAGVVEGSGQAVGFPYCQVLQATQLWRAKLGTIAQHANEVVYGTASYLRMTNLEGAVHISLVMGKAHPLT